MMDKLIINQQSLGKRRTTAIHLDIDTYLKIEKASILTGRSKTELVAEMVNFAIKHTQIEHKDLQCNLELNVKTTSAPVKSVDKVEPINAKFVSVKKASEITGLSVYYIRGHLKTDDIPSIRIGKKWLINIELLLEELNNTTSKGGNS